MKKILFLFLLSMFSIISCVDVDKNEKSNVIDFETIDGFVPPVITVEIVEITMVELVIDVKL